MDRMSATIAVSANQDPVNFEFYLAAEAEATLFGSSGPISPPYSNFKLHGGLFAGRTCTDLPYAAWAPQPILYWWPSPAWLTPSLKRTMPSP